MFNENECTVKGHMGMYVQINSTEKVRGKITCVGGLKVSLQTED